MRPPRTRWPEERRHRRSSATVAALLAFGVVQAQPALIDSVDGLVAAFAAGGAYQLVAGTYTVPVPLVAQGEVTIVGAGRESAVLELRGGPIAVRVLEGSALRLEGMRLVWVGDGPSDVIVVRDGRVDLRGVDLGLAVAGRSATADPWRPDGHGSALTLQGAATAVVEDAVFARHGGNTIEVLDDATLSLVDSRVIDGFRGLVASGRARVEVRGGAFVDQAAQGVAIVGEARADFVQTAFDGNGMRDVEGGRFLEAIRVSEDARASFTGGVLRDAPTVGLWVGGAATVEVRDLRFEANGGALDGVDRWPAVGVTGEAHLAVYESSVTGSPSGAFGVRQSSSLVLENVEVVGVGGFAHTAVADQGRLAVRGGRFVGNAGVLFVGGEARASVHDTVLRDGAGHGVLVADAAGVELVGTVVAGHAARGVWVDGGASADVTGGAIEGNEMGVWLTGSATAVLTDVRVVGNRHSGVVLSGTARAVVETSEVSGHASNGVAAIEASDVIVRGSTLRGNAVNGVLVAGTATATLEGNAIEGGESGVRIESDGVAHAADNTFADNGMDVREAR